MTDTIDDDGYPFDDEEQDDAARCRDCGCDLETEFHDWNCEFVDEDLEVFEAAKDCDNPFHPGCHKCEVKP